MRILDKLFGRKSNIASPIPRVESLETISLVKTSEMLDEDLYWAVIDRSLKNTESQDDQEQYLIQELTALSPLQIVGFRLRTDKLLFDSYRSDLWCAGYIMNGGCSDDGFEYFRNWVISRGKNTYYKAKDNPDSLVSELDGDIELYDFESFWYVALDAFNKKTGKDLYNYIDEENFKTKEGNYPEMVLNWRDDKLESMMAVCPQLFERCWDNDGFE